MLASLEDKLELRDKPGAGYLAYCREHVGDIRESVGTLGWHSDLIVVAISCRESETASPDPYALVEYLAWHEIKAEAIELADSPRRAARAIVKKAIAEKCDLSVLGAYIHTRAHSLVFGSMTEHVLSDSPLPALVIP